MPEEEPKVEEKVETRSPEVSKPDESPKKKSKLPLLLGVFGILVFMLVLIVWYFRPVTVSTKIKQPDNMSPTQTLKADTSNWIYHISKDIPHQNNGLVPNDSLPKTIQFALKYPSGWKVSDWDGKSDTFLELSKDNNSIIFSKGKFPQLCDNKDIVFEKEIKSDFGSLRRVKNWNKSDDEKGFVKFVICSKEEGYKTSSFGTTTSLGSIKFKLMTNYKKSDLEDMDKIMSTIIKIDILNPDSLLSAIKKDVGIIEPISIATYFYATTPQVSRSTENYTSGKIISITPKGAKGKEDIISIRTNVSDFLINLGFNVGNGNDTYKRFIKRESYCQFYGSSSFEIYCGVNDPDYKKVVEELKPVLESSITKLYPVHNVKYRVPELELYRAEGDYVVGNAFLEDINKPLTGEYPDFVALRGASNKWEVLYFVDLPGSITSPSCEYVKDKKIPISIQGTCVNAEKLIDRKFVNE